MPVRLADLADRFGCELIGDGDILIETVASLGNAGPGSLSFLSASTFRKQLPSTKAAAVILRADDAPDCPAASLISDNPYAAYARIAAAIHPARVFTHRPLSQPMRRSPNPRISQPMPSSKMVPSSAIAPS
jgi:UDP-3-O-[3-hydroxymyristoyl] glucosamine N-acyltransferase